MTTALLALTLCAGLTGDTPGSANLDFSAGRLTGWEGEGFLLMPKAGTDPAHVTSADRIKPGHTALLHRAFEVPRRAGVLRFRAAAVSANGGATDELDVALMAAGRKVLPKRVLSRGEWHPVGTVLASKEERWRDYQFDLTNYTGHTLRLVLFDQDARPGCHLLCGGFEWLTFDEIESREFSAHMVKLVKEHNLGQVVRYDSPHFTALSNADDLLTESNLQNCEVLYALFTDHFRQKGFAVREAPSKLMVAMFDTPDGMDKYLGEKLSDMWSGIYDRSTNRMVVHDQGNRENYRKFREDTRKTAKTIETHIDRQQYQEAVQRIAREARKNDNIGLMMHELAHQLSFNVGLFNRAGDVPAWLGEGLACYCEATRHGVWQGIGELSDQRLRTLGERLSKHARLMTVRELVTNDDPLRRNGAKDHVSQGYAQSWALFHMLITQQPAELRRYVKAIYPRQVPDHRLADFVEAFGSLNQMEHRYREFIVNTVKAHGKKGR